MEPLSHSGRRLPHGRTADCRMGGDCRDAEHGRKASSGSHYQLPGGIWRMARPWYLRRMRLRSGSGADYSKPSGVFRKNQSWAIQQTRPATPGWAAIGARPAVGFYVKRRLAVGSGPAARGSGAQRRRSLSGRPEFMTWRLASLRAPSSVPAAGRPATSCQTAFFVKTAGKPYGKHGPVGGSGGATTPHRAALA